MRKQPVVYFEKFMGLTHDEENKKIYVNYQKLSYEDLKKEDFLDDLKKGTIKCVVIDEFDCVLTVTSNVEFREAEG